MLTSFCRMIASLVLLASISTIVHAGQGGSVAPSNSNGTGADSAVEGTESELVTDRPDFTESSHVVGRGVLQVETGFSLEGDGDGASEVRSSGLPMVLARIGVSRRVEIRFGADGLLRQTIPGIPGHSGFSDVEVGFKATLLNEANHGVDAAVLPILSLPTHNRYFSSDGFDPTVKLTWARSLPKEFGVSGNFNVSRLTDGATRFAQQAVSLSIARGFGAGVGAYWEVFRVSALEPDGGRAWTVDTGISRSLGSNAQVDVEVGRGLSAAAPDWFVGFGFAVRHRLPAARR